MGLKGGLKGGKKNGMANLRKGRVVNLKVDKKDGGGFLKGIHHTFMLPTTMIKEFIIN